jgi:MFS family permease
MLMPFGSAFAVNNLGIAIERLPVVYMSTGAVSIFAGPLLGRLSDSIGKYRMLFAATLAGMVLVVAYTGLGVTPFWLVIVLNMILFVVISARMISSQALNSAVPEAKDRGAYMSVNASIQQLSGGVASALAGLIVVQTASGKLEHYDWLGYVVVVAMGITLFLMYSVHKLVQRRVADAQRQPATADLRRATG